MSEELIDLLNFSPAAVRLPSHEKFLNRGWVYCETKRLISKSGWDKFIWLLGSEKMEFRFVIYHGIPREWFGAQLLLSPDAVDRYKQYNTSKKFRDEFDAAYLRGSRTIH